MIRFYFKVLSPFFVLLAVVMLVIHMQPYNDGNLRSFFNPSGDCQMPCFMGITPGVTTFEDAIRILEGNRWVSALTDQRLQGIFYWKWSGQQPALIDDTQPGWLEMDRTKRDVVGGISIPTRASVGELSLLLGKMSAYQLMRLSRAANGDITVSYSLSYVNNPVSIGGVTSCSGMNLWQLPATITYRAQPIIADADWTEQVRRNTWCR